MGFRQFMEENGHKVHTTFWEDFSVADSFGIDAVKDTFERAFSEWKRNHIYLTELVIVLNHKIWEHYQSLPDLAEVYNSLWQKADAYAVDNLKGDELEYFYITTD